MTKKFIFAVILFVFFFAPLLKLQAQLNDGAQEITFNPSSVPQWAKDLRRYEIIAFGTFPFTMLFTTIGYDMYLRNNSLQTPSNYYGNVIMISAGASLTLALVDIIIVKVKRSRERRRMESVESGTYEIEREPYGEPEPD
jgi:surface polysaccharide O-acyltransferase-like enzyme